MTEYLDAHDPEACHVRASALTLCNQKIRAGMYVQHPYQGTATCRECVAAAVEQELDSDQFQLATGADLDILANQWMLVRLSGETDQELRVRIQKEMIG